MKRSLIIIVALTVLTGAAILTSQAWSKHQQKKRAADYQAVLSSYQKELKRGVARRDVEKYLRERDKPFIQRCCQERQHTFTDLVWIGNESAPWYCSENNIYIGFQFVPIQQQEAMRALDSDRLEQIVVLPWLEGCL